MAVQSQWSDLLPTTGWLRFRRASSSLVSLASFLLTIGCAENPTTPLRQLPPRLLAEWDIESGDISIQDLAVGPDGTVFVLDYLYSHGNRVQRFAPDGTFAGSWLDGNAFPGPSANHLAVETSAKGVPSQLHVYVLRGLTVDRYDYHGRFELSWQVALRFPRGIAVNGLGDVLVAGETEETSLPVVHKYTSSGTFVDEFYFGDAASVSDVETGPRGTDFYVYTREQRSGGDDWIVSRVADDGRLISRWLVDDSESVAFGLRRLAVGRLQVLVRAVGKNGNTQPELFKIFDRDGNLLARLEVPGARIAAARHEYFYVASSRAVSLFGGRQFYLRR